MPNSSFNESAVVGWTSRWIRVSIALAFALLNSGASAAERDIEDGSNRSEIQRYCGAVAPAVDAARTVWQIEQLGEIEKRVGEKIALLEKRLRDVQEWTQRRDEFLKKADENTVAIFTKMKPEAAAAQLANMDERDAASVLARLPARAASLVLGEMEPARAARLARLAASNGAATTGAAK